MNQSPDNLPLKPSLMSMWIIWSTLLLGEFIFLGVVKVILIQNSLPPDPHQSQVFVLVNWLMLVMDVPVVFLIRRAIFKRSREDGVLPTAAYFTGNLLFWAGCEGCAFFSLVAALTTRSFWPHILIGGIAAFLQVITFPKYAAIRKPDEVFKAQ